MHVDILVLQAATGDEMSFAKLLFRIDPITAITCAGGGAILGAILLGNLAGAIIGGVIGLSVGAIPAFRTKP